MKITSLKLTPVHTPRQSGAISQHVILELFTDEGLTGLGEMSDIADVRVMPDLEALKAHLEVLLLDKDPLQISPLNHLMRRTFGSITGLHKHVLAVDMALHDLAGKALEVPVYRLLGGKVRDRIKTCYPIFPCRSKEEVAENMARVGMRLAQGHDMIRYYYGANLEADELFLQTLRSTYGQRVLLHSLDGSARLPVKEAIPAAQRLEAYGPLLVESPVRPRTPETLAEVRRAVRSPICEHVGDFNNALCLAQGGAIDILNIGGTVANMRRLAAMAEELGLSVLIGTTQELSIGTAIKAHLGATLPNLDYPCDPMGPILYEDDVVMERVRYENGYMIVPEGVGLGVELDEGELERLRAPLSMARRG